MSKWKDIVDSDKYQDLSNEDKFTVKKNFALKFIVPSETFQSLDSKQQQGLLENFAKTQDDIQRSFIQEITRGSEAPPRLLSMEDPLRNLRTPFQSLIPIGAAGEAGVRKVRKAAEIVDRLVEIAATAVETIGGRVKTGVPTGRTVSGLAFKDFPRFFAAEIIRSAKPTNLIIAKGLGTLLKPVARFAGPAIAKHPVVAGTLAGGVVGGGVGFALDEENRLRGAAKGAAAGAAVGLAGGAAAGKFRDPLRRFFFVDRGAPKLFRTAKRKAELEAAAGTREAEEVGRVLRVAQEDTVIRLKDGGTKVIKKGQRLPTEHQRFIGRIFRKEVDLGGRQSRLVESPDVTARINKSTAERVASSPKLAVIKEEIKGVNRALRDPRGKAEAQVGKKFRTDTGFIEEATGVEAVPRISKKTGKVLKKPGFEVTTEPRAPTTGPIPSKLGAGGQVLRETGQVSKAATISKAPALTRKQLLARRKDLAKELSRETQRIWEETQVNYAIFDRQFAEKIRTNPRYKNLSKIANEGRDVMDKWSKELVKSGIPSKEAKQVIEANVGEYMARMYEKRLIREPGAAFTSKRLRLRLDGLRKRKQLTEDVLRAQGLIKEPALPTALRVKQISESVANNKLFKTVASNPEWTANTNVTGKMIQMADTPNLGPLRGKWVVADIAEDINATLFAKRTVAGQAYSTGLAAFKFGKVVLNPPTHVRNMITNTMLLDFSGVSHARQAQLMPRVMKDYIQKGPMYQKALAKGAIGGEFSGEEVKIMLDYYLAKEGSHMARMVNMAKIPFQKAAQTYQAEEQLAKMVKFTDVIGKTGNAQLAAAEAQKWLFDYRKIPRFIELGKNVAPFVTFTYKAIPRVAETMVNRPLRVYKYFALFNSWNEAARKANDMTPSEYARETNSLPPWLMQSIGGFPTVLLLPGKSVVTTKGGKKVERTRWLNLEYILPLGMAPEVIERGVGRGGIGEALGALVGNPYFTALSDQITGKDFRGQDFIPLRATMGEEVQARLSHLIQGLAPSLTPAVGDIKGGYSFEKLMEAVNKKQEKFRPGVVKRELTPTLADIFAGLKITMVDVDKAESIKMIQLEREIKDLESELFSKLGDPDLSNEDQANLYNVYYKKIQSVIKEVQELGRIRNVK